MGARTRTMLAALAALCALMLIPSTAAASGPAQHETEEDIVGEQFVCQGGRTYTITAGSLRLTFHEGESRSGNTNFTGTLTPTKVLAQDSAGNVYQLRGAVWFGGTVNSKQGTEQFAFTGKIQIVSRRTGRVDSVNQTFHITIVNGNFKTAEVDMGTCQLPE